MNSSLSQGSGKDLWSLLVWVTAGCWILIVLNALLWWFWAADFFSVEPLHNLQRLVYKLTSSPVGDCLLNFAASFAVAYISFPLYHFFYLKEGSDLFELLSKFKKDQEGLEWELRLFILRYAACTGFLATALIHAHGATLNLDWAIFLGFVGPYVMRDKVLGQFKRRVEAETPRFLGQKMDEVRNIVRQKEEAPLAETMKKFEEDLERGEVDIGEVRENGG